MLCKNCKKPIQITLKGKNDNLRLYQMPQDAFNDLKFFCSYECKKAHRMAYQASWLKKKRNVDISGGYIGMDSQNVDTGNPHEKPIEKAKNRGHGLSEGNFFINTIKEGENFALKYCPEFKRKQEKDYCLIDGLPHEIECKACINGRKRDAVRQNKG